MEKTKRAELKEWDDDAVENYLDETFEEVDICGMKYSAGRALKELDPTAFRCARADMPEKWVCTVCDSVYETEDEAEACCEKEWEDTEAVCDDYEGERDESNDCRTDIRFKKE